MFGDTNFLGGRGVLEIGLKAFWSLAPGGGGGVRTSGLRSTKYGGTYASGESKMVVGVPLYSYLFFVRLLGVLKEVSMGGRGDDLKAFFEKDFLGVFNLENLKLERKEELLFLNPSFIGLEFLEEAL